MIAVAEPPLEFVPRGRQSAAEHPGPHDQPLARHQLPTTEHLLLQRLQNVNISSAGEDAGPNGGQESWTIRELYDDYEAAEERAARRRQLIERTKRCGPKAAAATQLTSLPQTLLHPPLEWREEPMCDYMVNNEEELYVHRNTVVWTQGFNDDSDEGVYRRMCFTSDSPVRFACFLNRSFVRGRLAQLKAAVQSEDDGLTAICVMDQDALRVYCNDGEDYLANLDFPVSQVWQTKHGLLLEKDSSNALISHLSIPMPRLFSMSHPLHEACPVVLKTATSSTGYMTEPEYSVVFTTDDSDLVLLYDAKFFKHFVARLRKVTPDEVNYVGQQQELGQTLLGSRSQAGGNSFSSTKHTGAMPKAPNVSFLGRTNTTSGLGNLSKFGLSQSQSFSGVLGQSNRASLGTPLSQLQSSISQQSMSVKDMRKMTHVKPAKPIEPEMCLEHIWTENTYGTQREFCEMATRAFIHTDLVGQTFLCYLLARSCRLQMVRLTGYGSSEVQLSTLASTLAAKDAVGLNRLHMIAVLDPGGSLILYTGTVLISKVHITPLLAPSSIPTPLVTPTAAATPPPTPSQLKTPVTAGCAGGNPANSSSFVEVRRSSLLPTKAPGDLAAFDEELHMLSPIQPQPVSYTQRQAHNVCKSLRDPAGNRLTLVYATGRMLRIALPLLNDTRLLTRCVATLRQILSPGQFLHFVIRWYSARNPPGSRDYSIEQEWLLFRCTLLSLMGLTAAPDVETGESYGRCATPSLHTHFGGVTATGSGDGSNCSSNSTLGAQDEPKKRRKYNDCEDFTDDDWEFLLLQTTLAPCGADGHSYSVDINAPLFQMIPAIFFSLHLLYEDLKLDAVFYAALPYLATFLHQLAIDMQLDSYVLHYILDFPELSNRTGKLSLLGSEHGAMMLHQELLRVPAPSVFAQLEHIVVGEEEVLPYSFVDCVNERSRNLLQLVSLVVHGQERLKHWWQLLEIPEAVQANYPRRVKRSITADAPRSHQMLELILAMRLTRRDIERFPAAVHLIVAEALEEARLSPPMGCSMATYELILRPELAAHAQLPFLETSIGQPHCGRVYKEDSLSARCPPTGGAEPESSEQLRHDDMDNMDTKLLRLRFPDDMRVEEVRRLLNSSEPVVIEVQQSPGTSDHEFIEEQEKQLFALCARTMTLPLGRGMFTLRTMMPRPSDSLSMPKLCLVGREPLKGTTIEMQQIEFPANMQMWPSFHNGVATGLKISPQAQDIDSTWIVYNKPKAQANNAVEHAGFLMALGLNGHLKTLSFMSVYKYLVKCDEMTNVGLLLGISAAHRGSMDTKTTKLLSVHLEALLPATAMELDIPQSTQVAALMGIGLLYQGSAKRHIAEVLLQEIGRPPGPEMENSVERESYAMTAGLSLGLVTLGQGESPAGLRDLQLPDTLHYYMVGGVKRPISGSQKEKYRLASFQVREGDSVNIDVTAPGATLALGLMFFNSGNAAIAEWMQPPDSRYLLDMVRPDFLLLRTIARGLILWQDIRPDNEWFQAQFPQTLRVHLRLPSRDDEPAADDGDVDFEAITQAYCNIMAGAAFCIGLKYAGTEDMVAFATLRTVIKEFLGFPGTPMGECAGRTTVESCLMVLLISISLVFAGSGNCEILRIIRYLRSRVGPQYPHITYGSHMAIHMSLGLLFLGAGRFTIAKTPESIAALVCAFFPKFPIHSNDNRYHLQALRHLYVLAVEPRLFLPRDIDTNQLCLANISVLEVGATEMRRLPIAPCILPVLSSLQQVVVDDENYWPVCFERSRNWHQLEKALEMSAPIDIKKRTGCLSHLEDPDRLKSMLAQTLTMEQSICWQIDMNDLQQFASERMVKPFLSRCLATKGTDLSYPELVKRHQMMLLFYNAVVKDRMHLLPVYLTLYDHVTKSMLTNIDVWQLKLIDAYLSRNQESEHPLISVELIQMMQELFKQEMEDSTRELCVPLREFLSRKRLDPSYVTTVSGPDLQRAFCVINYYNLLPNMLNGVDLSTGTVNYMRILFEFRQLNLGAQTIFGLLKILQALSTEVVTLDEAALLAYTMATQ